MNAALSSALRAILFLAFSLTVTLGSFRSSMTLSNPGTTFVPNSPMETPLKVISVSSAIRCAQQCNDNPLCRTLIYDSASLVCRLYPSDLQEGNLTATTIVTSRVGSIRFSPQFYTSYNQSCAQCRTSRYLVCQNGLCQCPSPTTFWNGQMCQNQFYSGAACNSSNWCRHDLNVSCILGACQPSTASR